jgi:putative addiction module killer protein
MAWSRALREGQARRAIAARIDRLAHGNPGNVRPVGHGVSELRINHGPGYRVYFAQRGSVLIVLLCGGDKGSEDTDIERALTSTRELKG